MVRNVVRGALGGLVLAAAGAGATAGAAWAAEPSAAFGAPPPGHEPPPPPSPSEAPPVWQAAPQQPPPSFMTLDRVDSASRVGVQMGFSKFDEPLLNDPSTLRFNLHGQYVLPGREGGFYAQLPISRLFIDEVDDETGIGNPEIGGFFLPMRNSDLILRAGLVAGVGSDGGVAAAANLLSTFERTTDILLAFPEYWTARLSASTVKEVENFFFRADGGFDLVVDKPSSLDDDPSAFFRANVGGGVHLSAVDLLAELANIAPINGDVSGGWSGRFVHSAALGARTQGPTQVHLGAVFPLDEDIRGDVWILSLGVMQVLN